MERNTAEKQALPHGFTLRDRKQLTVSGVHDVANFDENQIVIATGMGTLIVRGSDLHVDQLSLDTGELCITGHVDDMAYDDGANLSGGFFRKLLR